VIGFLETLAASRALRPLARLGALSPATTIGTFAPGARRLLEDAERGGELALHAVRALLMAVLFGGLALWLRPPPLMVALEVSVLTLIWLLVLRGLRSRRTFTLVRYLVVPLDVSLAIGGLVAFHGPLAQTVRDVGSAVGLNAGELSPEFFAGYVPPLLVFTALSSGLRLDPRAAALTALLSVASYLYFLSEIAVPPGQALLVGGIVVLAGLLGANTARVARYLLLKTQAAAVLETYVPEMLSRDLDTHGALERTGRLEEVTLLLCDMRGFTRISERLSPSETVTMVNAYLDAVCPPIASAGGVIDKFMGDGVLAFFEGGGNASRAVDAARRVLDAVERLDLAGSPVRIGVALHSGQVLVGTVGPRTRREYTIISDAVNTVSRLEELNKAYGSAIVASAATIGGVDEPDREGFEGPVEVAIRGRGAAISVYVLGASVPLVDQKDLGDRLRRFVGGEDA